MKKQRLARHRGKMLLNPKNRRKTIMPSEISDEILFGTNPVLLALRAGQRQFYRLLITEAKTLSQEHHNQEILRLCSERNIPVKIEEAVVLKKISCDRPHQGLCLECSPLVPSEMLHSKLSSALRDAAQQKLWLLLDGIYDPMNLGAIMRSAYFFGVERIFLMEGSSCPLSPIVSKASAGVMEILPIHVLKRAQLKEFVKLAKEQKWDIVGTVSKNEAKQANLAEPCSIHELQLPDNVILVFGNENKGIDWELLQACPTVVTIQPGRNDITEGADCLNVSVAAGVILSHIAWQRQKSTTT
ncbi:rRNA methyltransferase 1, mitochondrial-like isoform X2 [Paramacrobiotus metropolitanus]|uniref:rRNA methyltransferase 1, mitochondrial-like isoform X2 n=1 Tax=Paramacrobiotus metropolitanus TaxID=2943436 RepID=UPI0024464D97|nr:rRNA methyltransferase 1, mitochondrial-like isoform X2 [Paramacrobiotus metropolitanus]